MQVKEMYVAVLVLALLHFMCLKGLSCKITLKVMLYQISILQYMHVLEMEFLVSRQDGLGGRNVIALYQNMAWLM